MRKRVKNPFLESVAEQLGDIKRKPGSDEDRKIKATIYIVRNLRVEDFSSSVLSPFIMMISNESDIVKILASNLGHLNLNLYCIMH